MRTRWIFTGCDTDDERLVTQHWEPMQPGLEARLETPGAVADDLVMAVDHDRDAATPWRVQAVLGLPAGVCVGDAQSATAETALQESVRQLTGQLDNLQPSTGEPALRKQGLDGLVPFLQQARRQDRMAAFAAFLLPLLISLRRHAARELAVREMEEEMPGGQWEVDDLLDETLLLAWDHFDRRPQSIPLDAWLVGLIGQVLETTQEDRHESLSRVEREEIPRPVEEEASQDQWVERPQQLTEEWELSDLLPGRAAVQTWEQIDPEHRDEGLNHLLGRLSRSQREALVMSAVHGFAPEEIAMVQHVSPGQAKEAINAGRDQLERLIDQEEFWPQLQQSIERRRRDPRRINR